MNKKLFLTSILAMVFIAPAMAGTVPPPPPSDFCPLHAGPDGTVTFGKYSPGTYTDKCAVYTCSVGHYCPDSGTGHTSVINNLYSCPSNYDNTATGLKSIEECCLGGYNSSTGLCNEGVFPSNGLMKENKTYINAATSTNMDGIYSGSVNAVAEYDIVDYILSAGQYLPADSETPTTCPAGSFCSGIGEVQYNETSAQGITSCPSGFGSSETGSSSNTQCYRTCDIDNMGDSITAIAHATAISGNDYYGSGTDTCVPTACENGWHVKAAVTAPDLTSLIGITEAGEDEGHKSNSGTGSNANVDTYGITQNGEFVVDYGSKGKIHGHAQCSTQEGTNYSWTDSTITTTLPDSSGQYCYCQLDSYTPLNGSAIALSAPWVLRSDTGDAALCAEACAYACAYNLQRGDPAGLEFRAAMFSVVQSSPAMCEANTITINWSNASDTDIATNNAGTATYGSDVRTPVKAETIKGKTFKGWKFSKPEQTTTGGSN